MSQARHEQIVHRSCGNCNHRTWDLGLRVYELSYTLEAINRCKHNTPFRWTRVYKRGTLCCRFTVTSYVCRKQIRNCGLFSQTNHC